MAVIARYEYTMLLRAAVQMDSKVISAKLILQTVTPTLTGMAVIGGRVLTTHLLAAVQMDLEVNSVKLILQTVTTTNIGIASRTRRE